jgi:hypothetical protein
MKNRPNENNAIVVFASAAVLLAAIIAAFVFSGEGCPARAPLSEEEALAIAKRELGDYGYDHDAPIVVRRGPDYFDFIFPEPHHGPPDDDDYYGADFAARVRIDSRTGAVVEIEAGG